MRHTLAEKNHHLKRIVADSKSAVVAFSGGIDSTFLLAVCAEVLEGRVLAVTAESEIMPRHELVQARELTRRLGVAHVIVESNDLDIDGFADNPPDRCYLCKKERFTKMRKIAAKKGFVSVFDGSNIDDLDDFRPGMKAVRELGVRSPLAAAGLGKADIRMLSKSLGLTTWDQPAAACLASRIPYDTRITRSILARIENAEAFLRQQGMRVFRVRHHDDIARLELGEEEMRQLFENQLKDRIRHYFLTLGYRYVVMDLGGYRTGSLNEVLPESILKRSHDGGGIIE